MRRHTRERAKSVGPWVRVFIVLAALGVTGHGLGIATSGEYTHRGRTLATGVPARLIGGSVAAFGAVVLVRTVWGWWRDWSHSART